MLKFGCLFKLILIVAVVAGLVILAKKSGWFG